MLIVTNETLHQHGVSLREAVVIALEAGINTDLVILVNKVTAPQIDLAVDTRARASVDAPADSQSAVRALRPLAVTRLGDYRTET